MQPHANPGSDLPGTESPSKVRGPQAVPSHEEVRKPTSKWLILLVVLAVCGAGYWLWQKQEAVDRQAAQVRDGGFQPVAAIQW